MWTAKILFSDHIDKSSLAMWQVKAAEVLMCVAGDGGSAKWLKYQISLRRGHDLLLSRVNGRHWALRCALCIPL